VSATPHQFNVVFAEARAEQGLSIRELANRTGFTPSFVSSYEDYAKNPTMITMLRYAKALGLRVLIDTRGVTIEDRNGACLLLQYDPTVEEPADARP
jgi:transcriptional regulator with XRE-family HTH domain